MSTIVYSQSMDNLTYSVEYYVIPSGSCPIEEWKSRLDKSVRARVDARLDRIEFGNFGDAKHLEGGIYELRFKFGPGYRIYYALDGQTIVLLLNAGDKSTQVTDIEKAKELWNNYRSEYHA